MEHRELVLPSFISSSRWLQPRMILFFLILLGSGLIRLSLFQQFPALLTNDSWDYIRAAENIHDHTDFFTHFLRDVRMPAYPVFLALTQPVTGMVSSHLVLLQKALGMLGILLGGAIGLKFRSGWVTNGLALFLGFNPAFLLFEHAIMPDTLFIFLLLALILLFTWSVEGRLEWYKAAAFGTVMGLCVLTRSSVVPLCVVFAAGVAVVRLARDRAAFTQSHNLREMAIFVCILSLLALVVVGPWLWRNYLLFGNVSLINFNNRNLLIYKAMHDDFDVSLPLLTEVNRSLGVEPVAYLDYAWLGDLSTTYPTREAESIARALVREQVVNHPTGQASDMLETFLSFGSLSPAPGNDRFALRFWFIYLVHNAAEVHRINTPPWSHWEGADFVYVPTGGDTLLTDLWRRAGIGYLVLVRPVLFVLFFSLHGLFFVSHKLDSTASQAGAQVAPALVCGAAYLTAILGHVLTLTDNDRYIAALELPSFLFSVSMATYLYQRWRGKQRAGESAREPT